MMPVEPRSTFGTVHPKGGLSTAGTEVPTATRDAIDLSFAEEFGRRYLAAFNSHRLKEFLSLMTDDIIHSDSSWPKEMHGLADVREFYESIWRAAPDLKKEFLEGLLLDPTKPRAVVRWRVTGTQTGIWDPPGLSPSGRAVAFEGVTLYEFRDGRTCRFRHIYDVADMMTQLGVLPRRGSRGEWLMIKLTNLTRLGRH